MFTLLPAGVNGWTGIGDARSALIQCDGDSRPGARSSGGHIDLEAAHRTHSSGLVEHVEAVAMPAVQDQHVVRCSADLVGVGEVADRGFALPFAVDLTEKQYVCREL